METTIVNVGSEFTKPEIDHITEERWSQFLRNRTFSRHYNDLGAFQSEFIRIWGKNAEAALEEYDVLLSLDFKVNQKYGAVFPQIDINGIRRNAKVMAFGEDGHRLHEKDSCMRWNWKSGNYEKSDEGIRAFLAAKGIMYGYEYEGRQSIYGEHLLPKYPDKNVAICEGETTATVCSAAAPDYVWLATGGMYGCRWYNPDVYKVLKGRNVTLFPDLGAESEWEEKGKRLAMAGIDVSIFSLEDTKRVTDNDRQKGLDIADYYKRLRIETRPELANPKNVIPISEPTVKKASAPTILAELSKLTPPSLPQKSIEEEYLIDMGKISEMDNTSKINKIRWL